MTNNSSNIVVKSLAQQVVNPKPANYHGLKGVPNDQDASLSRLRRLLQLKSTHQQTAITERLSKLEDRLHNLLACYQFYNHAIRVMTDPTQLEDSQDWYFGLFLNQQWLTQQGEQLMTEQIDWKSHHHHDLNCGGKVRNSRVNNIKQSRIKFYWSAITIPLNRVFSCSSIRTECHCQAKIFFSYS